MEGYKLINQYHDSLKDWDALNREEQIALRAAWLGEEAQSSWLYAAIGGGLGSLFHEAALYGGLVPKKYAVGTLASSAAVGAVALYFLMPMVERLQLGYYFDQMYQIKEI